MPSNLVVCVRPFWFKPCDLFPSLGKVYHVASTEGYRLFEYLTLVEFGDATWDADNFIRVASEASAQTVQSRLKETLQKRINELSTELDGLKAFLAEF
jgi:hypothetical protein